MTQDKKQALLQHLQQEDKEIDIDDIQPSRYDSCDFEVNGEEYLVLTDEEADEREDEYLDQYIEDCILNELPERYRHYFDSEAWKRDARMDGRAHSLSTYDGNEYEQEVNGVTYYIYRTN